MQPYQRFQQHGFARTAAPDDEVGLPGQNSIEMSSSTTRLSNDLRMCSARIISAGLAAIRLKIMITTELATTAMGVEAAPTS